PVFSRTNACAESDQPSLKLVVSAEIQICRTGVFGLMTKRVSSSSSNSISSLPAPPSTSKSCWSPISSRRLRRDSNAASHFFRNSCSSIGSWRHGFRFVTLADYSRFTGRSKETRLAPESKQCMHLFFELIAVRQADESLRDFAVARDHDRCGQTNQSAEL